MLEIDHISKSYQGTTAVNDVSFHVKQGEFYGLLGPNGAGKTTCINMISTLLKPDSGTITIAGKNAFANKKDVKMMMGIVPQEIALYDDMSAYDNLLFWGGLYGLKGQPLKNKAEELLSWMELADRKEEKIKKYSGGMKRRINIATALMHDPKMLLMDEPTVGIDPQSRNKIYDILTALHKNGMTILYTTHYMQEAENMCDRVGIIDTGKIIAEGTLDQLKAQNNSEDIIVITCDENDIQKIIPGNFGYRFSVNGSELQVFTKKMKSDLPDVVKKCSDMGIVIRHIDLRGTDLETIFLNLTGRQLRE